MHYEGFHPDCFVTGKLLAAMITCGEKSLFEVTDFRSTHRLVERTLHTQWDLEDLSGKHKYTTAAANPGLNFTKDAEFFHESINFVLGNFYTKEEYAQITGSGLIRFFPSKLYLLSPRSQASPAVMSHGGTGQFYRAVFPLGTRPAFVDMLLSAFPPVYQDKDTGEISMGPDGEPFHINHDKLEEMKATMLGNPAFWRKGDGEASRGGRCGGRKRGAGAAAAGEQAKKKGRGERAATITSSGAKGGVGSHGSTGAGAGRDDDGGGGTD